MEFTHLLCDDKHRDEDNEQHNNTTGTPQSMKTSLPEHIFHGTALKGRRSVMSIGFKLGFGSGREGKVVERLAQLLGDLDADPVVHILDRCAVGK